MSYDVNAPPPPFHGEAMECFMCKAVKRHDPAYLTDWTVIESQRRRVYICPKHIARPTASEKVHARKWIKILKRLKTFDPVLYADLANGTLKDPGRDEYVKLLAGINGRMATEGVGSIPDEPTGIFPAPQQDIGFDDLLDRAHALWQLLDDIDTLSDAIKPDSESGFTLFYHKAMEIAERRHKHFYSPDGHHLFPTKQNH